jgi:hypothetical protein
MELRDFIVTPIVTILVYLVAYFIRPMLTNGVTRKYYFPALTLKIIGALAVGFIYQFYYDGGDTFAYHTHGSRQIWNAIMDSPSTGLQMLFQNGSFEGDLWDVSDKIWFWRDRQSFFIVRIATVFDLFTFSSYSATAVLFAVLAFAGSWMLYLVFYEINPNAHFSLAICCLFIPSVIFWGSGILKDTVTFAFVGVSTFCLYKTLIKRRFNIWIFLLMLFSFFIIYSVKKYILIGFIAGIMVWFFSNGLLSVRSLALRLILVPICGLLCLSLTFISVKKVMEDDTRYSIDRLAHTSMITAYDIRYGWGARAGNGSGYTLGEVDGTWTSMLTLAPNAINVSLFRPYLWEVNSPLMILSAMESLVTLLLTLYVLIRIRSKIIRYLRAEVVFCLVFASIFAFGVGVSTFNFGTLSRYKIPLLPFYWSALAIIYRAWKDENYSSKDLN